MGEGSAFPPNPQPLSSSGWRKRVQRFQGECPRVSGPDCAQRKDAAEPGFDAQTDGQGLNPRDADRTNTKEQTGPGDRGRQNDGHFARGTEAQAEKDRDPAIYTKSPAPGERRATHPGAALGQGLPAPAEGLNVPVPGAAAPRAPGRAPPLPRGHRSRDTSCPVHRGQSRVGAPERQLWRKQNE